MAAGWSNYQVTQGYLEWFYYVKFAVVSAIAIGFACFSVFRVLAALRGTPSHRAPLKPQPPALKAPPETSDRQSSASDP